MLTEEEIKKRIRACLIGSFKCPYLEAHRYAGILEGYLTTLGYFPPGLLFGQITRKVKKRGLFGIAYTETEGYVTCIKRHTMNYLEGKPLELEV